MNTMSSVLEEAIKDGIHAAIMDIVQFRAEGEEENLNITGDEIKMMIRGVTHYINLEVKSNGIHQTI
ncbi:MAG: hypothetical protein A3F67_08095 [Verrucomicrobia bacterium RIFCSPHIGHO2_12_FULL_41_10]|nr:MAG: hypothetical protein A3F67_08095 [Verrucomicrobia bacterium RIFCSPHIGHO2_12_FULL_41_10]